MAREMLANLPPGVASHVSVVNAKGYLVYNSLSRESGVYVGDREHFQALRDGAERNQRAFRWDRDPKQNLLYVAGIHACPGAGLARLELQVVMEELLVGTRTIAALSHHAPEPAQYPAGGYAAMPMRIQKAAA